MLYLELAKKRTRGRETLPAMRTNMTLRLTIIILLTLGQVFSQTQDYKILDIKPTDTKMRLNGVDIFNSYALNSFTLYVGWTKNPKDSTIIPKIIIKDKSDNVIFSHLGHSDSYIYRPTFFVSNSNDNLIIMAESGSEYSWGNDIFTVKNNVVKDIGFIDVVTYDPHDNPGNIAPQTTIKFEESKILFTFKSKQVVFNSDGKNQKIFNGSDIWYVYSDNELKMKTHSR